MSATSIQPAMRPATSHMRWSICALLFFATTINYIDRQVLSILAKTLETSIGWTTIEYGYITASFQAAYAVGLLSVGRVMDAIGTRKGFSLIITVWSLAAMAHAAAFSAFTFGMARFMLGIGEAGNFPASIKTVAEWFPKKERALATGIFNGGANIGAVIAPLAVPWIAIRYGWQWAFIITGAIGFLWLILWLALYRRPEEHARVSPAELKHIQSDPPDPETRIAWARLVPLRQTWAFTFGKFLTDPVWWLYLFWLPKYLQERFGLRLDELALPLVIVYLMSDAGSILGGWLSSALIHRGWNLNRARKTTMLVCALSVLPVIYAPFSGSLAVTVLLVGLATAAHQGWSANLFTITSDMFPRRAVGSVVGFGGTGGAIGGALLQVSAGYIVQLSGSYVPLFIFGGMAYLLALLTIHHLAPALEPVVMD
jgi:ACS family hexuronate transporter-like MFS transporter